MKHVLLLGATGTAGSAITEKLLSDTDYHITLFARHAGDRFLDGPRMTVVNGDAENVEDLKKVMPGQDVVYCAISGDALPQIAENIVAAMSACGVERLIFMGAVGIYNEIPEEMDGEDNLDNEPAQLPNRQAADVVEASRAELYGPPSGLLAAGGRKRLCPDPQGCAGEGVYHHHPVPCEAGCGTDWK